MVSRPLHEFLYISVSHDDSPNLFSPLFFTSITLLSPKDTKLSHPLKAMIKSQHRAQHTPSTAYTESCIHPILYHPKIDFHPHPASLSADLVVLNSLHCHNYELTNKYISKMYFSLWKPPGISERMWGVNLDASSSGDYETLGRHYGRCSE